MPYHEGLTATRNARLSCLEEGAVFGARVHPDASNITTARPVRSPNRIAEQVLLTAARGSALSNSRNRPRREERQVSGKQSGLVDRRNLLKMMGGGLGGLALASPVLAACGSSGSTTSPGASKYPTRPVTVLVGYGTGGGSDVVGRRAALAMSKRLGVEMPVVNAPGAAGSVGMQKLISAPTDGYTIETYVGDQNASVAVGTAAWKPDEIVAVARLENVPSLYYVNSKNKLDTIDKVIAYAKANPGKLKIGTSGRFSLDEIVTLFVQQQTGAKFTIVPYSKPAERFAALMSGELDVLYEQTGDVKSFVDEGQYRPIVIFAEKQLTLANYKDVPTSISKGWDITLTQFRGLVARAGTDQAKLDKLSNAAKDWSQSADYQKLITEQAMFSDSFMGPADFKKSMETDIAKIKKVIKDLGVIVQK